MHADPSTYSASETIAAEEPSSASAAAWKLLDLVLRIPSLVSDQTGLSKFRGQLQDLAAQSSHLDAWIQAWLERNGENPNLQTNDWLHWALAHQDQLPFEKLFKSKVERSQFQGLLTNGLHLAIRAAAFEGNISRELEQRKRQAIYNLAYGLSHDFNNPLANISTRAGVLLQQIRDDGGTAGEDLLQSIIDNAMRGCEMLGDLMLVARPPAMQLETTDFKQLLETLCREANAWSIKWEIRIELDCSDEIQVRADRTALKEAIWALLRNAIEVSESRDLIQLRAAQNSESRIQLEILDDGPGLTPHALANCFDPYFSGREAGRGMGLGLAKAQRILELHSGEIRLENREPRGCRALAWLPACNDNG
ncbi:MAG: sensor histidine kinase [Aureliella sp.]